MKTAMKMSHMAVVIDIFFHLLSGGFATLVINVGNEM